LHNSYALEVAREELMKGAEEPVVFENYEGPHHRIDTREAIFGIGRYLAENIEENTTSYYGKYSIIHAVDPSENDLFDADIFIIEAGAEVNHIRNLRFIISGFLSTFYNYSEEDANLLARFVTYYNAVFRKKMDYFRENYKQIVLQFLSPEKVGLSTFYGDWPGNTMIVIPLTEIAEEKDFGSIDSDELSKEEVIEELRESEDKGTEDRKKMVELKEREVERAEEKIAKEEEELKVLEEQLSEKEETDEKASADEAEDLAMLKEDLEKRREELEKKKKDTARREERIREERELIAEDTRRLIEQEETAPERVAEEEPEKTQPETEKEAEPDLAVKHDAVLEPEKTLYFLSLNEVQGEQLGRLVLINPETGDVLTTSAVNTIRERSFSFFNNFILVLAGREEGTAAVRLLLLDPKSLETAREAKENIFKNSAVVHTQDTIFAVVEVSGKWHLGKFNSELKVTATSPREINPYTIIVIEEQRVFVQDIEGNIIGLKVSDLEF